MMMAWIITSSIRAVSILGRLLHPWGIRFSEFNSKGEMEYSFEEPNSEYEWPEEVKSACIKMLCELHDELKSIIQGMGLKNEKECDVAKCQLLGEQNDLLQKECSETPTEADFSKEGATIHQAQEVFDEISKTKN